MRVLRRKIRRSKADKAGKRTLRPSHAAGIDSLKGGGSPLPPAVRRDLEPRFGLSFGPVRVHTDARAARTAKAINARAFTTGKDVVFGPGQYSKVELEGLPSSIEPSLIEFRAYVNQFVHFFHKLNIPKQEFLAKAVILFYPLKKQKVKGGIQDPSLDLVKARTQVINYFNNPPGNAQQKQALKRLICIHFQKLIILRPADSVNIERDFSAIFKSLIYQKMKEDRDLRKKVKKNHKPF
jgi:hypothetical protein